MSQSKILNDTLQIISDAHRRPQQGSNRELNIRVVTVVAHAATALNWMEGSSSITAHLAIYMYVMQAAVSGTAKVKRDYLLSSLHLAIAYQYWTGPAKADKEDYVTTTVNSVLSAPYLGSFFA
jgi:hypothetical protein